jgi:formylglycine-generating enzyme required for sulfatase activity
MTISMDFWMGQFPAAQRQWLELMGNNPSYFQSAGPGAPVEQVS